MKKEAIIAILAVFVLAIIIFLIVPSEEDQICFDENCFFVDIADTNEKREKGLMYKEYLPDDRGMLFIFPESGNYNFWMKNTIISLDIIWIDENFNVVYIAESQSPCTDNKCDSINPNVNAKYVLEVNGGISEKIGLNIGDELFFE